MYELEPSTSESKTGAMVQDKMGREGEDKQPQDHAALSKIKKCFKKQTFQTECV